LQDVVKLGHDLVLDNLETTGDLFDSVLKDLFSLFEGEFHHVHHFLLYPHPQDVKHHIAQLHVTLVIGQCHYLVHAKWHHLQRLFLENNNLPIQNTRICLNILF
jgi:hypothetical protein